MMGEIVPEMRMAVMSISKTKTRLVFVVGTTLGEQEKTKMGSSTKSVLSSITRRRKTKAFSLVAFTSQWKHAATPEGR
jgi:hypothetical protein